MRIFQIPTEFADFPNDDIGDDGDLAVNVVTGDVKKKINNTWSSISQPLAQTVPPDLAENLGFFSYGDIPGLTELTFINITSLAGFDIEDMTSLVSLTFPNLVNVDTESTQDGYIYLAGLSNLTTLELPNLVEAKFTLDNCDALTSLSLPSFQSTNGTSFNCTGNALLQNISLPSLPSPCPFGFNCSSNPSLQTVDFGSNFTLENGQSMVFTSCALSADSVNYILARLVANAGYVSGLLQITGTSAAPSGQGIIDKATLQGRGVTVSTN